MNHIPAVDATSLLQQLRQDPQAFRLIDVRSPAEFSQGIIAGAQCVPLHLVPLHAAEWIGEGRPIVFYCRTGARSAQATLFLLQQAPEMQVLNLSGGIFGWVQAGGGLSEYRQSA